MKATEDIHFTLKYGKKELLVNTFDGQFLDLRELIMKKFKIDFFGECGGVGRCVTCMVELNSGDEEFACQISVDSTLNATTIKVIGDRLIPI